MICPHCGKDSSPRVVETRQHVEGVMRKRMCGHCGRFYTTLETVAAGLVTARVKRAGPVLKAPVSSPWQHNYQ